MTKEEKEAFIDDIPDWSMRMLYKVLLDRRTYRKFQEYGGNPKLKDHNGTVELVDGSIYHIWEE